MKLEKVVGQTEKEQKSCYTELLLLEQDGLTASHIDSSILRQSTLVNIPIQVAGNRPVLKELSNKSHEGLNAGPGSRAGKRWTRKTGKENRELSVSKTGEPEHAAGIKITW